MDITVTRKYRGRVDSKGRTVPTYNYGTTGKSNQNGNTTIINNYNNPLETTSNLFMISLNFKAVLPFTYICPDDMIITAQEYDNYEASIIVDSIAYVYEDLLPQYKQVTIVPTGIGTVLLMGEMKL